MNEEGQELDIKRYLRLVYRRRVVFLIAAAAIMTAAAAAGYLLPPSYEAKAVVLIERNFINQLIKDITVTPSIEERVKVLSLVMKSRPLLMNVIQDLDLDLARRGPGEVDRQIERLQKTIELKLEFSKANRRDMDSFALSYRDSDPRRAMDVVNTLIRRYIEENITLRREEAFGANRFLLSQIDFFKSKIDAVEEEIDRLQAREGVTARDQLGALQKRLDTLLIQYTDGHPEVVRVRGEIEELREQMKSRKVASPRQQPAPRVVRDAGDASRELDRSAPAIGDLRARAIIDSHREALQAVPAGSKKLSDLERERDVYRKIYEDLVATLGRSEVSTHAEIQDKVDTFRVVDPAVLPTAPVSPDRVKIMLLGLLGGIAGAFGLLLFLDYLDDSVKSVDVLKAFNLPILAVIPSIRNVDEERKGRRRDLVLFGAGGAYLLCFLALLTRELII